ncbi:unnamed protein product [Rotaria socialis]|uniref:Uncharacterized protein n=1 Tax=Rotaria socialis TaxID=392032 RepID=A0A820HQX4_9BILA|nr:unnamed protein product [Rotaria socialis]CAF4471844.1 unnamed protein product [Rotaria socialis]
MYVYEHEFDSHCAKKTYDFLPQLPILFVGTCRYNLHPFEQCLLTLASVQLKYIVYNNANVLHQLVSESASNFSSSQCQLICVVCIILKQKNKIWMIDQTTD